MTQRAYLFAADFLLWIHVLFVLFVVLGLVLILAGGFRDWEWVRHPLFRWLHAVSIGIVAAQAWLGMYCPLTVWEMSLRELAGDETYSGAFIAHWMEEVLYFQAPLWVFAVAYTLFGLLVAGAWIRIPPRSWRANK